MQEIGRANPAASARRDASGKGAAALAATAGVHQLVFRLLYDTGASSPLDDALMLPAPSQPGRSN
jgi:hypothetical protein